MQKKNNIYGLLFAGPWIIGFLLFSLYPILAAMYYSLTKFNLMQPPVFIGLENYIDLFKDELFIKCLYNTFYMLVIGTPVYLVTGLLMAMLLNLKVSGMAMYRTIFYIPTIVPPVAQAILWFWVLNPEMGLLNTTLKAVGLPQPNWMLDPALTKPSLILIGLWGVGNIMVIFLASLQEIPISLLESADIDGANGFRKLINITLPWISPVILYQLIIAIIGSLQYFTQAYVVISGSSTNKLNDSASFGGPENSLMLYSLYLFHTAFNYFKMGKATAMAWIMFIISAFVTWLIFKTSSKWVNYGGE